MHVGLLIGIRDFLLVALLFKRYFSEKNENRVAACAKAEDGAAIAESKKTETQNDWKASKPL